MLTKSLQSQAVYLMCWQLLVIIGFMLILMLVQGKQAGVSALLGGLAYWLPTLLFALRLLVHTSARRANLFVFVFFAGEMIKLFLSAILFLLIVKYLPVSVLSTLLGFISAIVAFWVVCGWYFIRKDGAVKK